MPSEYYVEIADPFGTMLARTDEFLSLDCARSTRGEGELILGLDPAFPRDLLRWDGRIGIWRKPEGGPLQLLTETIWLMRWREEEDAGESSLTVKAFPATHLLGRRIVAYPADSAQASKSGQADNIMKAIVRENLGALAIAARDWSAYLAVEADTSLGPVVSKAFAWRYVLAVLQELHEDSVVQGTPTFFDVVAPITGGLEFRTYVQQRGMDHTLAGPDPIVFSVERGNLARAKLTEDHSGEITCAYAGGQGKESDRTVVSVLDAVRAGLSPFGRIETFRDARNVPEGASATAQITAEATAAVREGRPRRSFVGEILDTEQCAYGVHWQWGDRVSAEHRGVTYDCLVSAVRVTVADGQETIAASLQGESAA